MDGACVSGRCHSSRHLTFFLAPRRPWVELSREDCPRAMVKPWPCFMLFPLHTFKSCRSMGVRREVVRDVNIYHLPTAGRPLALFCSGSIPQVTKNQEHPEHLLLFWILKKGTRGIISLCLSNLFRISIHISSCLRWFYRTSVEKHWNAMKCKARLISQSEPDLLNRNVSGQNSS